MADMEQDEEKKKKAKEVAKSRKQPKKDRNIQKAAAPKQEGEDFLGFTVDSDTKQALTYFLPQVIGGLAGGLFEGTAGALAGAEAGKQATEGFQQYRQGEAEIGLREAQAANQGQNQFLEAERLNLSRQNLLARQKELQLQEQRAQNLDEERDERRFERSNDRVLKQKEAFTAQADVKKSIEQLRQITDLENLAEVKVLPGTIGFKIAKGIAGEVGNLTEEERAEAQIAPSIWNRIKRYATKAYIGEIPKEDIKLIKQVGEKLKSKVKVSLKERARKFAKSRRANLHPAHAATFEEDIILGIGLSPDQEEEKDRPKATVQSALERIRAIRGRK
jgi:hypothetical protein